MGAITLSGLNVYPVKSAAGIALSAARVDARGLAGDRRWMVVDENRSFLSQRTHPRLALVSVAIDSRGSHPHRAADARPCGARAATPAQPTVRVRVWRDVCDAVPAGDEPAAWLSRVVGAACELVYMPESSHRSVAARGAAPPAELGFADAFPFLLISEGSLADLNRRLEHPLPMNRFRPNLVVRGCSPYAEDGWRRITIAGIVFHVVKPCSRCITTTVNQRRESGAGSRSRPSRPTGATGDKVLFGQNLVHEGIGQLAVGDEVVVVEPRTPGPWPCWAAVRRLAAGLTSQGDSLIIFVLVQTQVGAGHVRSRASRRSRPTSRRARAACSEASASSSPPCGSWRAASPSIRTRRASSICSGSKGTSRFCGTGRGGSRWRSPAT